MACSFFERRSGGNDSFQRLREGYVWNGLNVGMAPRLRARIESSARPAKQVCARHGAAEIVSFYFLASSSSADKVSTAVAVRMVGSRSGAKVAECNDGSGVPVFFAASYFPRSPAPT